MLFQKKFVVYRLDVTPAYNSYLENILSTKKLNYENNSRIVKIKGFMIAKKGILTEKNTLIVDNLRKPKKYMEYQMDLVVLKNKFKDIN